MKIRSMKIGSVILATAIVGHWISVSYGGDEEQLRVRAAIDSDLAPAAPAVPIAPGAPAAPRLQQIQGPAAIAAKAIAGSRARTNMAGSIRTAAEAVRDAKDDEAKDSAKKVLSDLLGKYFDEDTKRREEELAQIEERLTKLRELLERRRAKKQDILDLQMKVALNEADGLGFYDSEHSAGPMTSHKFFYDLGTWGEGENPFYASPAKSKSGNSVPAPKPAPKKTKPESKSSSSESRSSSSNSDSSSK